MRRLVWLSIVSGIAVSATAWMSAKNTPRSCAVLVSTDGSTIQDPTHATCQAGGRIAVVFCNDSGGDIATMTLYKDMLALNTNPPKPYAPLKSDVTARNVKARGCSTGFGTFEDESKFGNGLIPYTNFKYKLAADKLSLDPDLDVSPPTGVEVPPARGRARGAAGR